MVSQFINGCHQEGIKVSAYLSLTNMFWEDMFREEPHFEEWIQRDENGKPILYADAFYSGSPTRYLACLNHKEWRDYLKKRVDLALKSEKEYTSKKNPDLIFYCNAHQKLKINEVCNAIFTEDAVEPGTSKGEVITNVDLLKELYPQAEGWKLKIKLSIE